MSGDFSEYDHIVAKPKTKSPVWVHFGLPADENGHIMNNNVAICKICSKSVPSKGGSTSNLSSHLKHHHPLKFRDLPSSSKVSYVPNSADGDCDNPSTESDIHESSRKRQKTMLDFQPLDNKSSKACTEAITKFIAKSMQPYATVEHSSFIQMIKTLNPRYKLPGRKYFSTVAIPKLYSDTVEKIKRGMKGINSSDIAMTTDCWTSISNTPFLSITVHYISDDWELINACLSCKHFIEDHTAENIVEMLTNTLQDWDIDMKTISCATTDNGSNILKAISQLPINHCSCFAHNINIGVNGALQLPQLKRAVARLKKLQNTVSHGWKMKRDLQKAQELMSMTTESLPSACPTRWWSTLKLVKRFLTNQIAICKMLMDYPSKKHLMLEGAEVNALQDFVSATNLLEDITKTLSGSNYITASCVLPLVKQIKKNLTPNDDDSSLTTSIKKEIFEALSSKYDDTSVALTLGLATLCDPRFRLRFLDNSEEVKEEAVKQMRDLCEKQSKNLSTEPSVSSNTQNTKKGLGKFFDLDVEDTANIDNYQTTSIAKAERELADFLAMPKVNFENCPLKWWKSHESSFPLLKVLARRFLGIPGTSVPSESVFSVAGNVITKERASLLPDNAEMQIFLVKNSAFIDTN